MTKPIAAYFDEEAAQHDVQFVHDLGLSPFYDAVEQTLNSCKKQSVVLVLGCGSGLEIERIRFACEVIGIDLSEEMLNVLKRKQLSEGVKLTTVCASFLEWDLGMERYDIVLSCYALHHFNEEQKHQLYRRIHACLADGGVFINGDLFATDSHSEQETMQQAAEIYANQQLPFASLHVDVPFCWEHENAILEQAGFSHIRLLKEWTNSKLYQCFK